MTMTYSEWLVRYAAENGNGYGRCISATKSMKEAFPELKIVKGHVETPWGRRGHAWLTDPTGAILDPTAAQFPKIFEYDPWKPGDKVMVGKCMNCGDEIWLTVETLDVDPGRPSTCTDRCSQDLADYMNRSLR